MAAKFRGNNMTDTQAVEKATSVMKRAMKEILATAWKEAPSPENTLFLIKCDAKNSKPGAQISQDEVKAILHKHAAAAPNP